MKKNLKVILLTAVGTTLGWVLLFAGYVAWAMWKYPRGQEVSMGCFSLHSPTNGAWTLIAVAPPGQPNAVEWNAWRGEYLVQLVSSNSVSSNTAVVFERRAALAESFWFITHPVERLTNPPVRVAR